jgi:thioredoxin
VPIQRQFVHSSTPLGDMDEVTSATFADEVLASPVPVIVDFWAPWCRPCDTIEPHLRTLAEQWSDRVRLVRVDVDAEPGLSSRYGVLSLPTVVLFTGGEPTATVHGAQPRTRYERAFAAFL